MVELLRIIIALNATIKQIIESWTVLNANVRVVTTTLVKLKCAANVIQAAKNAAHSQRALYVFQTLSSIMDSANVLKEHMKVVIYAKTTVKQH
jgi:hypothetical protein